MEASRRRSASTRAYVTTSKTTAPTDFYPRPSCQPHPCYFRAVFFDLPTVLPAADFLAVVFLATPFFVAAFFTTVSFTAAFFAATVFLMAVVFFAATFFAFAEA